MTLKGIFLTQFSIIWEKFTNLNGFEYLEQSNSVWFKKFLAIKPRKTVKKLEKNDFDLQRK